MLARELPPFIFEKDPDKIDSDGTHDACAIKFFKFNFRLKFTVASTSN